jgi:hypothetical protein
LRCLLKTVNETPGINAFSKRYLHKEASNDLEDSFPGLYGVTDLAVTPR